MKVLDGTPFALTRHLRRLRRSCAGLGIDAPDDDLVREACAAVVAANGAGVGRLRITVTAGRAPLGSGRGDGGPALVVLAGPPAAAGSRRRRSRCARGSATSARRSPASRRRATPRTSSPSRGRRRAGAARRCSPTPAASSARAPARTCSSCSTARSLHARRSTSGCLAGVTRELLLERRRASRRTPIPIDALAEVDRGVPHVVDPRRPPGAPPRRPRPARARAPSPLPPRSRGATSSPARSTREARASRIGGGCSAHAPIATANSDCFGSECQMRRR